MDENVIQIKSGKMKNVDASVKTSHVWKGLYMESYYMQL